MTALVVLRHGPTEWSERGLLQGRADPPLSAAGRAAVAAWRLPAETAGYACLSSPLRRCVETARLLGREPTIDARLIEMDWGELAGRSVAELRQSLGGAMTAMEARGLDLKPPGGETPRQVQDRLRPLLVELSARGRPALAVCHKGVIRALLSLVLDWDMTGPPPVKLRPACCHVFRLRSATGTITLDRPNVPLSQ